MPKKEKALGERAEAEAYWKQSDREDRIAFWKEIGRNAFVAFIASLTMRLLMAWFRTR